jgi:uncharacterized protein YbcI
LEEIPVGEKTIELLLSKLKSVKRIKEANQETLEEILGKSKAKLFGNFSIITHNPIHPIYFSQINELFYKILILNLFSQKETNIKNNHKTN